MTTSPQRDFRPFLFGLVESEEDLRVLAWFRHLDTDGVGTAGDVANATGMSEPSVSEALGRLVAKGLLGMTASTPVGFRYAPPPSAEFSETLDAVLERYTADPPEILRIMSANSVERVTLAALRSLEPRREPK